MTIEEDIKNIEDEIRKTSYNKATMHHIGRLKAKLARLKEDLQKRATAKSAGKCEGYTVKNPIINLLITKKEVKVKWENETHPKSVYLGNDADIMMVLDVLKFISDDKQNIYNYLRNTISNSGGESSV